jgi:hypothetical protein
LKIVSLIDDRKSKIWPLPATNPATAAALASNSAKGIIHDYNSASKTVVSIGDAFTNAMPIVKVGSGNSYIYGGMTSSGQPAASIFNPPVLSNCSWVNQGGASATQDGPSIYFVDPTGGSDNIHALVKSIPSAPCTITIWFVPNMPLANYNSMGILLRNSSSDQ